jgi:hypothetical protein
MSAASLAHLLITKAADKLWLVERATSAENDKPLDLDRTA